MIFEHFQPSTPTGVQIQHPLNGQTPPQEIRPTPCERTGHIFGNHWTNGVWAEKCYVCGVERTHW